MGILNSTDIYFITLQHCVGLLKEEVNTIFPTWQFKQGHHNFLTYGTDRQRSLEEIRELPLTFKIGVGKLLSTGDQFSIEEMTKAAQEEYDVGTIHYWDLVEEDGKMGDRKIKGQVLDIIRYADGEYALGLRFQVRGDFSPYKGRSPIPCPAIKNKNGYQKMGEAFKHFRPHIAFEEVFLDLGCAPGGGAYYLLEHGLRVIGVDLLDVDSELTEKFNEGFLQLNQPVEEINVKHLKGLPPIDWVVFDLGIKFYSHLPFLSKLISKLDQCQGVFLHVGMDEAFDLEALKHIETAVANAGYTFIRKALLPSHGKEFCLFAKKED